MSELDFHIDGAAWSGNHLLFASDNPVVERKLRRPELSPSVAATYNACPARAAGDRLMPRVEDPFAANEMGTAFHSVMEELYALEPEKRTREAARDALRQIADEKWATDKLERKTKQALDENHASRVEWETTIDGWVDGQFQLENPPEIDVFAVEYKLDGIQIGAGVGGVTGIPLKGFVDRTDLVTVGGERRLSVVDFKAGKPKLKPDLRYGDDYGDQQRIYFVGYTEKTGVEPVGARLMFPRGPGVREIDVSKDAIRKTLLAFRAGWNTMNESADRRSYEARPSALCSWCPLVNSCPMGKQQAARANKPNAVAARAKAPSEVQLGIPTLRAGLTPTEAFAGELPGVTMPSSVQEPRQTPAEPVEPPTPAASPAGPAATPTASQAVIEPVGDDLFPVTIPDAIPAADEETTRQIESVVEAVHMGLDDEKGPVMTTIPSTEDAPYKEEVNGMLNLNSYAAGGLSGIVSLAYSHLNANSVRASPANITHFARVLARIVQNAQREVTGTQSFQLGSNTRLRGFLHTHLEHRPAPFGGTVADWEKWIDGAERFLRWGLTSAIELWQSQPAPNADDYLFFASDAQAQGQPTEVFAPANA